MLGFSVHTSLSHRRNSAVMSDRGWICLLLLTTLAWGQAEKPSTRPAPPKVTTASPTASKAPEAATVPRDAAVITIPGLCDKPSLDKAKATDCKTVITRAEFEQLVDA